MRRRRRENSVKDNVKEAPRKRGRPIGTFRAKKTASISVRIDEELKTSIMDKLSSGDVTFTKWIETKIKEEMSDKK